MEHECGSSEPGPSNSPSLADLIVKRSWDEFHKNVQAQAKTCFKDRNVARLTKPVMIKAPFGHDPNICLEAEHADIELRLDGVEELDFSNHCQIQGTFADFTVRSV